MKLAMTFAALLLAACGTDGQAQSKAFALAGTEWSLISIQSMDDSIGTKRPEAGQTYTMSFAADGKASFVVNCNRANGTWKAEASASGDSGTLTFGPLGMTKMLCPAPSLDTQVARDMGYVRTYLVKDGKLYLSLMADAAIYAWEPLKKSAAK